MKKTLILQCPGMVYSPPVVSKCLGEAHRRLELFTLHYIKSFFFSILLVICVSTGHTGDGKENSTILHELGCVKLKESWASVGPKHAQTVLR